MSVHKLSAQQTLGLLIKKRDAAFKRGGGGGCESVMLTPNPFNVAHVWRVIYKLRVDSPQLVLCGKLAAIVHCHAAVILPSTRNMTGPWARLHVVLSTSSFLSAAARPGEALFPPRTQRIDNGAVNSSSRLISQVVTGRAARICWLSKVNGAKPLACSFSRAVWWLARDVRPQASIKTTGVTFLQEEKAPLHLTTACGTGSARCCRTQLRKWHSWSRVSGFIGIVSSPGLDLSTKLYLSPLAPSYKCGTL